MPSGEKQEIIKEKKTFTSALKKKPIIKESFNRNSSNAKKTDNLPSKKTFFNGRSKDASPNRDTNKAMISNDISRVSDINKITINNEIDINKSAIMGCESKISMSDLIIVSIDISRESLKNVRISDTNKFNNENKIPKKNVIKNK